MSDIRGKGGRRKPCPRTPGKVKSELEVVSARLAKTRRRLEREFHKPTWSKERIEEELDREKRLTKRAQELVVPAA